VNLLGLAHICQGLQSPSVSVAVTGKYEQRHGNRRAEMKSEGKIAYMFTSGYRTRGEAARSLSDSRHATPKTVEYLIHHYQVIIVSRRLRSHVTHKCPRFFVPFWEQSLCQWPKNPRDPPASIRYEVLPPTNMHGIARMKSR
jgi:hypothetical protein